MSVRPSHDISSIIRDGTAIDRAIVAARRRVIQRHGNSACLSPSGETGGGIEVAPESVELPDDTTTGTAEP
jgi:hypothetical protein